MGGQVSARIQGDDYQHLYAWLHALELLMPGRQVATIIVEDNEAGSADDVTVLRGDGALLPDRYHQVKYHVDQRAAYSADFLVEQSGDRRSLLQKWFRSWNALVESRRDRSLEIHVVSNWGWAVDGLSRLVNGASNRLKTEFFKSDERKIVALRERLAAHLGASSERFAAFADCLRFHFGYACWQEMAERAAERMQNLGLKSDEPALLVAVGIVRGWVKAKRQEITKNDFDRIVEEHGLLLPESAESGVNVYLATVKDQEFEIQPDHVLDWRGHFVETPSGRGHETIDPSAWNDKMFPELVALEATVGRSTACRLVRARGLARLSAWFAFGFVFAEVARYTIEIDQQGKLWRTDAAPSADFEVSCIEETHDSASKTVAVGVSVSGVLDDDVRRDLEHRHGPSRATLFLRPKRELGRRCLRDAGDAAALAESFKREVRDFVKKHGATRLLLYYFGPLSGACFIGHQLNSVCETVVAMERVEPGYLPAFTLA